MYEDHYDNRLESAVAYAEEKLAEEYEADHLASLEQYAQAEIDRLVTEHPELQAQVESDPDKFVQEFGAAVAETNGDFEAAYHMYATAAAPPPRSPRTIDEATRALMTELRARRG